MNKKTYLKPSVCAILIQLHFNRQLIGKRTIEINNNPWTLNWGFQNIQPLYKDENADSRLVSFRVLHLYAK